MPKLSKSANVSRSYLKNKSGTFFETRCILAKSLSKLSVTSALKMHCGVGN